MMISASKSSLSFSSNPVSDIKPTITDSPMEVFVNKTTSANASSVADSVYGDSIGAGTMQKSASQYGDSLTNSSQTFNLSGGSSITDGGAIMAMFNVASKAIEANSLSGLITKMQAGGIDTATSAAVDGGKVVDNIKKFFTENKTVAIGGGLLLGYLIYRMIK